MDLPSPMTMSSLTLTGTDPVLTIDRLTEECPRFRILVLGRSGTGKSSLINAIFKASLADVRESAASLANINKGITSSYNEHLIIHDPGDYEPGNNEKFRTLEMFVTERCHEVVVERLHAIWLCVTVPFAGNRMFEEGDAKIFKLNRNKVPIIVVFTKLDLLVSSLGKSGRGGESNQELAETYFKEHYGQIFDIAGQIQYALVAISLPDTLERLVDITMRSIWVKTPDLPKGFAKRFFHRITKNNKQAKLDEDVSDSAQMALATAQRIDTAAKITASINKVGKKKYWKAIASGIYFLGISLHKCLYAIHKDMIKIWNIRGLDKYLFSNAFFLRMVAIVDDLNHQNAKNADTTENKITIASTAATGPANAWSNGVYQKLPDSHIRCLMGYVVDLTLILQAIFQVSLQDRLEGQVTEDRVDQIISEFHCSYKKKRIHEAIRSFVGTQHPFVKDRLLEKIDSLIKNNEMMKNDTQFDLERHPLPSLLTILRSELMTNGLLVNQTILGLTGKLLVSPDFRDIVSETSASDVELLLDFILHLLQNDSLSNTGIPDANRKARRLMFKLISDKGVLPKSLFIDGEIDTSNTIGIGGFGNVLKGEYRKQQVALRVLYKGQTRDPRRKDICREALAWRSLSHRFILPLLGIFEEKSLLFLVSPFMTNGSLIRWRENNSLPVPAEIHRLILEVAEGIQYIHSEGIVHGDLRGENILLDADLHCQITNFGLTRHSDATTTQSNSRSLIFAAPELFGLCEKCGQLDCDGCQEGYNPRPVRKTMQTDVYAFGCLYYATFFGTAPFEGKTEYQIILAVTKGVRPDRLSSPIIDNGTWLIIERCWRQIASERPPMQTIIETMAPPEPVILPSFSATPPSSPASATAISLSGVFPSLLTSLNESTTRGGSTVNEATLNLACKLLDLPEDAVAASELNAADIELLLDFLLVLLQDNGTLSLLGIQDANRKARRLTFKLTSMTDTIPKSLYITNIITEAHLDVVGTGGFGRVYRASYEGKQVALKMVDKSRRDDSLIKDFLREAIAWRSLSHRFILPFLGIFKEKSQLFLVSPFMKNGTLTQWRREEERGVIEIHRMMLEVAEGIQYLHSEGTVHGDLHGGNVLLDSTLHCQITDFGSTRHTETTVTHSTTAVSVHFAAPELFGMCTNCCLPECDGCHEGDIKVHRSKTKETDVYAFGCLYYAIFFNTVPFDGNNNLQVMRLVTAGKRPKRLGSPGIEDNVWDLIRSCMETFPSQRPTMEYIVMTMASFVQAGP